MELDIYSCIEYYETTIVHQGLGPKHCAFCGKLSLRFNYMMEE